MQKKLDLVSSTQEEVNSINDESKELENYATDKISKLLKVKASEVIYTSGATESNNMVFKGIASRYKNRGNHIITSYLEHSSIIETCKYLEKKGFDPRKLLAPGTEAIKEIVKIKMEMFGCVGKAF